MSATNRGSDRIDADNYPTPSWCTRRILDALQILYLTRLDVREPCAGDGAIVSVVREMLPGSRIWAHDIRDCTETQKRAGANFCEVRDAVTDVGQWPNHPFKARITITNPPFKLAESIIRAQLPACDWGVFLVRQGFMSSAERAGWLREDMPDTYELPNRPSFVSKETCKGTRNTPDEIIAFSLESRLGYTCPWRGRLVPHNTTPSLCPECGGETRVSQATDAADYCWLVWTPERGRKWGRRVILPDTPLAERKLG